MPSFPFGELAPDHADMTNPGMVDVRNCVPGPSGYRPFRHLVLSTSALALRPRGAIQALDENDVVFQYAGDETKLYQNVDGTWTDVSIVGGYATGTFDVWEFLPWKNKILAVNFANNPQQVTFGGANFSNLTTALKAKHICAIRDFVVMGNTSDSVDGEVPSRVRWSAFNDETDYVVSPVTLSDFQDLKISKVQKLFGGEYGVVFQPERVWRMTFVGAPVVFQFDEVLPAIGLISPGAAAQDGDIIYFLSSKGFFALESGTRATPIGAGKVDDFINTDLDQNYLHRMSTVADPVSKRVYWLYPGAGNSAGTPNRIIVYDRTFDRWSVIDSEVELLWNAGGTGVSLDAAASIGDPLDIDDPEADISFDDPQWIGGAPFISAFGTTFASGAYNGTIMTAVLQTKEFAFQDSARSQLNGFRVLVQGGTVTARVGTRNNLADAVEYGSVLNARSERRFTTRRNARYHRFELTLSDEWQHAIGMEIGKRDLRSGGERG